MANMFQPADLEQTSPRETAKVYSFTDAQRERMTDEQRKALEEPEAKRRRYEPVPDDTYAVARIQLKRKPDGSFDIMTSKGSTWIDSKFILEGRYRNRWIIERFMLHGGSAPTKALVDRTRTFVADIQSVHGSDDRRVSMVDGLRVPIRIWSEPRWGDRKLVNRVEILSPTPGHRTNGHYVEFGKRRKPVECGIEMVRNIHPGQYVEDGFGRVTVIDYPGWSLHPETDLAQLLLERIERRPERIQKNAERAMQRMANTGGKK